MTDKKGPGRPSSKVRLTVEAALEQLNYVPLAELVKQGSHPDCDPHIKFQINKELLNYQYAKKKHVEHDHNINGSDLADLMKAIAAPGRPKPPSAKKTKPE